MPGYLLHVGATVICAHPPGQAVPVVANPRVKVSSQSTVVQSSGYTVAGCALTGTPSPPCATALWMTGAVRVSSGRMPLLLQDSRATCAPTGTPLTVAVTQTRVRAI
jgi:hypothetical protein